MSENYVQMKNRQQKEFEKFPCFFAFSQSQFVEGMISMGLEPSQTDMIYRGVAGMYYKKSDSEKLRQMMDRFDNELQTAINNDDGRPGGFIENMFLYELNNHEYAYTGNIDETLDSLGMTLDKVNSKPNLLRGLKTAMRKAARNL